jgi:hypothetical protein
MFSDATDIEHERMDVVGMIAHSPISRIAARLNDTQIVAMAKVSIVCIHRGCPITLEILRSAAMLGKVEQHGGTNQNIALRNESSYARGTPYGIPSGSSQTNKQPIFTSGYRASQHFVARKAQGA